MNAIRRLSTIKGAHLSPWKQTMFVDHYLAECVARRWRAAARIATKVWTDPEIVDFVEYQTWRFCGAPTIQSQLMKILETKTAHSRKVLEAVLEASYHDGTGEPGFINQHRLVQNDDGYEGYQDGKFAEGLSTKPLTRSEKCWLELLAMPRPRSINRFPIPVARSVPICWVATA